MTIECWHQHQCHAGKSYRCEQTKIDLCGKKKMTKIVHDATEVVLMVEEDNQNDNVTNLYLLMFWL